LEQIPIPYDYVVPLELVLMYQLCQCSWKKGIKIKRKRGKAVKSKKIFHGKPTERKKNIFFAAELRV